MPTTIILIGPISAGKTTVAKLLAQRLGLPHRSMDEVRDTYYHEIGYDEALAQRLLQEEGWWALYWYWKPFEAHAVERILTDHAGIIDLGAGHSVYEDAELFTRIANVLAPYPYVILLLPAPEVTESLRILSERDETAASLVDVNDHFLRHHSNTDLAKHIVYTKEKTPDVICDEIVRLLDSHDIGPPGT